MNGLGSTLVDRLVTISLSLLIAAILVVVAVHLIMSVWLPLVVIVGSSLVLTGLFMAYRLIRARRTGW
jgi:Na+/glutamate symporter